jgi:adenosylcobinamide-GDP ribazoletransferase
VSIRSARSAVAFLTIIPAAGSSGDAGERLGRAYFPAVGALIGFGAGLTLVVVSAFTTQLVGAAAALAVLAVVTGGLHLDGLADTADGLLGGRDRERRLKIMRDPRVGSFGAIALVLVLLIDVATLSSITPVRALLSLVVAGALSRWAMLWLVALLPYARPQGLGIAAAGGHRVFDLVLGSLLAALACLLDWRSAVIAVLLVTVVATGVAVFAKNRIGGATGDVYGAAAELCQLAVFVAFAVHL